MKNPINLAGVDLNSLTFSPNGTVVYAVIDCSPRSIFIGEESIASFKARVVTAKRRVAEAEARAAAKNAEVKLCGICELPTRYDDTTTLGSQRMCFSCAKVRRPFFDKQAAQAAAARQAEADRKTEKWLLDIPTVNEVNNSATVTTFNAPKGLEAVGNLLAEMQKEATQKPAQKKTRRSTKKVSVQPEAKPVTAKKPRAKRAPEVFAAA